MKRSTEARQRVVMEPSENVEVALQPDICGGDTAVSIDGEFVIAGADREKFLAEIGALIDRYRI